jgi:hypothetical protein
MLCLESHCYNYSHLNLKHVDFPKTQLAQALPYSFQVHVVRPGFASVSANSNRVHFLHLVTIARNSTIASTTSWMLVLSFMYPSSSFLAKQANVISDHALKLISIPKSHTKGGHHPSTLEIRQGNNVYFYESFIKEEATW